MKFLVAVDGSEHSQNAVAYAKTLVRTGDTVVAYTSAKAGTDGTLLATTLTQFSVSDEAKLSHKDDGDPREGIPEIAKVHDVDIIVLGSRGLGAIRRSILGSVSTTVVHSAERSCLVVHHPQLEGAQSYQLCIDGSPASKKATELLLQLLNPEDLVVVWYGYIPPPLMITAGTAVCRNPNYETETATIRSAASDAVEEICAILAPKLNPEHLVRRIIACNDPRDDAVAFADLNNIKCLVCGTRNMGALKRLALGSFSTHLIQNALKHAVLVVH
eukprot:TRINITY_DN80306_c0_g1_i1.p2 TRINITY_DN80306_c0_g1~~TRINITY_DN80306_c0_g1_i1.p2  ORF type:complete len:273 (+),score=45.44 TRINITY_DN80306_c0_g1_i1:32-850(+)